MAQGEQKQANIESDVQEDTHFIKECIEEKLSFHGVRYEMVRTIYVELLNNYMRYVREMFPKMSEKGVAGRSFRQEDLQEVWGAIEAILPKELQPSLVLKTNAYTFCGRSPGAAAEEWIKHHQNLVRYLLYNVLPKDQLTQLLSLSYWVFVFYSKKAEFYLKEVKKRTKYSKAAHYLHCDLLMTLITVKYLLCHHQGFDLPPALPSCLPAELKRDVIHYEITAEHPAFQRLILLNVLKILYNGAIVKGLTRAAPEQLASIVCQYFEKDGWSWGSKGVGGLLGIVKDQSRYMTLRSPGLRRNYVSDKTRCVLSTICRYTKMVPSVDQWEALSLARRIVKEGDYRDDGSYLPTSAKPPDMKLINRLHHTILQEVCCNVVGRGRCPPIDDHGRFIDVDFNSFITEIASLVVNIARCQPRSDRPALYRNIGPIVVSLQEIIAARWYLCECRQPWTMAASEEAIHHHQVLLLFVAFRVILLFLLPQNPYPYGVQQVAVTLPKYARIQEFNLPLHKLYEALRN